MQGQEHAANSPAEPPERHRGRTLNRAPGYPYDRRTFVTAHTGQTVGRSAELAQFDALLDGLGSGEGACVAVEGEPGIGKSRLLAELRGRAGARGHVVLAGAAAEFERDLPYGVWAEALDTFVAAQELTDERLVADLALALPSLRAETAAGDGRHRVHRAIRRWLGELAEREPVVVVLDDLHWSDPASVDLLSSIARRGMPAGVLLALGYRTGRAPHGLVATLAAAGAPMIEVTALSQSECRALAGELEPAHHTAIFRESGGNPFYALALAGAARTPAQSVSSDRLATDSGVPRPVAAALLEEFDALSPDARRLLDASAVAGDPFEPELAFAIAELEPAAGMTALDELLAVRLLAPTAVPRRFAFRHPLVRRAVYESTGGGSRMTAHGRAAAALAERGAAAVTRAHHVEQSAVAGDPAAIALLLEAATASAPRAPAAAARWYAAALRLQPEVVTAG
ncbi:AAA family ATPase, partial [Solirubrobacter taibaiensis]|nr:AAA family ATPase [Solirubrobacter taibaiensis]